MGRPFALVTGASSGIGYELSKVLAQEGYDLIVVAEDRGILEIQNHFDQHLDQVLKDDATDHSISDLTDERVTQTQNAPRVHAYQIDLASRAGVEQLCREIAQLNRPLDIVAINAGVGVGGDFARETDLEDELNLINLNVVSSVHLAKFILPEMVQRRAGRVLFTSSIAGRLPGTFQAVYSASKAFTLSFAQAIRNELKDTGVTVTTLMPGATETNFFHRAGMDDTRLGASPKDDPAEVAREAFRGLMEGSAHVIPGLKNKALAAMGNILPDQVTAEIHRYLTKPGSASRDGAANTH